MYLCAFYKYLQTANAYSCTEGTSEAKRGKENFKNFTHFNIFIASAKLAASLNILQTSSDVNRKTKELQDKISSL